MSDPVKSHGCIKYYGLKELIKKDELTKTNITDFGQGCKFFLIGLVSKPIERNPLVYAVV